MDHGLSARHVGSTYLVFDALRAHRGGTGLEPAAQCRHLPPGLQRRMLDRLESRKSTLEVGDPGSLFGEPLVEFADPGAEGFRLGAKIGLFGLKSLQGLGRCGEPLVELIQVTRAQFHLGVKFRRPRLGGVEDRLGLNPRHLGLGQVPLGVGQSRPGGASSVAAYPPT